MDLNSILVIVFSIAVVISIVQSFFYILNRNRTMSDQLTKANTENSLLNSLITQGSKFAAPEKTYIPNPLTKKELEVAQFLAEGLENKEIAKKMTLSVHTINNHLENMKEKTGCRNKPELILYILKNGIVD